jgi:outer membrane receptor protein involved in Fe transport
LGQAGNVKGGSIVLNLVSKQTFKSALLAGTAAAAAFGATAVPAAAQDSQSVEKVTVTGTRLKKRDYNTTSPITTVGSQTFELTQTTSVESLLNDLPQLVPGNTFTSNNAGGEDFATIDLRGLGPNRTLILVNGNRMPASSTTGTANISTIPAGLIDRVEVVTGGASAVYGSDAMAGVVNFILKKDFEGMQVTAQAGQAERGLAEERDIQALIGGNFAGGNGNITVFAEYFSREGVFQSEQQFSRTSASYCYDYATGQYSVVDTKAEAQKCRGTNPPGFTGFVSGGGSGTPPWGWITNNGANAFTNLATLLPAQFANQDTDCNPISPGVNVNTGNLSFNNNGLLTPRFTSGACGTPDRGNGLAGNSSRYNFAPDNYIVLPAERYNLSMFGHYDLEKDLTFNFGSIYSDSYTKVQLAATPATGLSITLTPGMQTLIQGAAPDLWAALQSRPVNPLANFTMDRRMNEVGFRVGENESSNLSLFASLEGKIDDNWSYELAGSFSDIDFVTRAQNSVNKTALAQGLAACQTSTGAPLGAAALPGCVALDIFGPGTLTAPMVNFLKVNTWSRTQVEEDTLSAFLTGDMWDLFGAGPMAVVAGGEYRYSKASFEVDDQQRTGNIFGFNATQDQNGALDVFEGYTEISVPIVKDQPFMKYLGVEGGYRISDYSTAGIVHTYKYGGEYSPFDWLKFRGVYNKATRVASVFEAFQNGDQGFPAYTDPCRDTNGDGILNDPTVSKVFCQSQGVIYSPGFTANNSQVQAFAFGNASLAPETAQTTTYGVVLQTGNDWFGIGNLKASVDKYDIQIDNIITTFGATFFINQCYQNNVNPALCTNVVRDPVTGQIDHVNTSRGNQGTRTTSGIDIQADYRLDLADIGLGGVFTVNELYSIIDSYKINTTEFAGTSSAGVGGAIFDWKQVMSATYTVGDWTLFGRWSYVPALIDSNFGNTTDPAASYVDVAVRYAPTDWMAVTLTVDNVADKDTPQTASGLFAQGNTDPQVYDVLGRTWSLSIKTKM